jgi:ankyrin repeat protein
LTALLVIKYKNPLGKSEFIEKFKDDEKSLLEDKALSLASYNGELELVKYLIENGVYINPKSKEKSAALILASQKGYFEIVKFLVENGADLNAKYSNENKESMYTAIYGHLDYYEENDGGEFP